MGDTWRYPFSKRYRIHRRADLARLFRVGRRVNDAAVTLIALPNELGWARLGLGVSKKHGSAPRRNRLKRLCREAFRLERPDLPAGWDFVLIPRPGREHTLTDLRRSLRALPGRVTEGSA